MLARGEDSRRSFSKAPKRVLVIANPPDVAVRGAAGSERGDRERAIAADERELANLNRARAAEGIDVQRSLDAALFHEEAARLHEGLAVVYDREDASPD